MIKNFNIKKISKFFFGTFLAVSGIVVLPLFLVTLLKDNFSSSSYDFVASADAGYTTGAGVQGGCQGAIEGGPCCNN